MVKKDLKYFENLIVESKETGIELYKLGKQIYNLALQIIHLVVQLIPLVKTSWTKIKELKAKL